MLMNEEAEFIQKIELLTIDIESPNPVETYFYLQIKIEKLSIISKSR